MGEDAIKKILNTLLVKEFPDIEKIMIVPSEEAFRHHPKKVYFIYIGIRPEALSSFAADEIKKSAEQYCKLVLSPNEKAFFRFFNPSS